MHPPSTPSALEPTARAAAIAGDARTPHSEAAFDLRPGRVDPALFPGRDWRRAVVNALARVSPQYGDPAGTAELRGALARWVVRSRGVTATENELIVTSGSGHGIDLVARVLVNPGDVVAVEEPGYPPVAKLLRSQGLTVVGVPVDQHGIMVDAIPRQARLIYVTPSHQFPLGVVLARHRRLELLRWAGRNNAAVLEDDYDSEFRHVARPLEPLQRLDRDGRVIYVGTFSKTVPRPFGSASWSRHHRSSRRSALSAKPSTGARPPSPSWRSSPSSKMVTSTNTCGGPGWSTGSDTDGWAEHSTCCPLATANSRRRRGSTWPSPDRTPPTTTNCWRRPANATCSSDRCATAIRSMTRCRVSSSASAPFRPTG